MSDPFVAEIRIFPFNFPPTGWAFCNGQLLPISQNTALFSLLGTIYGGDGKSHVRAARHAGQRADAARPGPGSSLRDLGEMGGARDRHAAESEIPAHTHTLQGRRRPRRRCQDPGHTAVLARVGRRQRLPADSNANLDVHGAAGAGARRRRPAAQQHAAVPDAELLHRAAGRLPAAGVDAVDGRDRCGRRRRPTSRSSSASTPRTRAEELAPVPWTDEQKAAFVAHQFAAQSAHYAQHYSGMSADVSSSTARRPADCWSRGGSARSASSTSRCCRRSAAPASAPDCCATLMDEARACAQAPVDPRRTARTLRCALYRRLGFRPVADEGVYLRLELDQVKIAS